MLNKTKLFVIFLSAFFVLYALAGGIMNRVSASGDSYRGLRVFTDVLLKISEDYVEKPDLTKAMHGGVLAMMEALDPYASFIEAETFESMQKGPESPSGSLGLVIAKRYGYAYVVSVTEGSPAAEKGMRTADLVESIGGVSTNQLSLWEVRRMLRGAPGTSVDLRVIRFRRTEPVDLPLTFEEEQFPEVSARLVEEGIGFLSIPHFSKGVAAVVSSKLKMLLASDLRGLVVDLRGSATGMVEEAVEVSDFFMPAGGKILTVRGSEGQSREYLSLSEPIVSGIPVVLLIDAGSSGAAEVMAGALLDSGVAETVGERTDGRGYLHTLVHLEGGGVLEVATQELLRPGGVPIQDRESKDSGIGPEVKSPGPDFVSNFFVEENALDEDSPPGEEFYRKLDRAIREVQYEEGMKRIRSQLVEKAA